MFELSVIGHPVTGPSVITKPSSHEGRGAAIPKAAWSNSAYGVRRSFAKGECGASTGKGTPGTQGEPLEWGVTAV